MAFTKKVIQGEKKAIEMLNQREEDYRNAQMMKSCHFDAKISSFRVSKNADIWAKTDLNFGDKGDSIIKKNTKIEYSGARPATSKKIHYYGNTGKRILHRKKRIESAKKQVIQNFQNKLNNSKDNNDNKTKELDKNQTQKFDKILENKDNQVFLGTSLRDFNHLNGKKNTYYRYMSRHNPIYNAAMNFEIAQNLAIPRTRNPFAHTPIRRKNPCTKLNRNYSTSDLTNSQNVNFL